MAMNALTGWFWSRIAAWLGLSGMRGLFVGVVAQAGMFFWFAMTAMIAVPMYLCASIAIYLVLSGEARSGLVNYFTLSAVLGLLFVTPHPTYNLGFFLPVAVVFLITTYPAWLRHPWRGYVFVFVASCVTALLLAAYRIAPVIFAIVEEGAHIEQVWLKSFLNHAYFGLTAFNPLALGINISESVRIAQLLDVGAVRHTQAHNALYFGIAPLAMTYTVLRAGHGGAKIALLAIAWVVPQFAYLYALQPMSDILYLAFYPLGHEGLYRPISNFAFLFLIVECLKVFSSTPAASVHKAIRECIVIAGLVLIVWVVMYAKMLYHDAAVTYEVPDVVGRVGFQTFVNSMRFGILAVMLAAIILCRLPIRAFGSLRFGLVGVIVAALLMFIADAADMAINQLPGTEMEMRAFKSGLIVICTSLAILLGMEASKAKRRIALAFVILAFVLFILPMPLATTTPSPVSTVWAGAIGWSCFIALLAVTLFILGRFANGDMNAATAVRLLFLLTVVDLVVAFANYSYVNVPSSPYFRHLRDIYPTSTLQVGDDRQNTQLPKRSARPNLLLNPEIRVTANGLAGWNFGGKEMGLCTERNQPGVETGGMVRLCYPRNDGEANLYQDVSLKENVYQVAMGVWVYAKSGVEVGIFLTSPSNNVRGRTVKKKGDGKWHWIQASLTTAEALKVVRPHINMMTSGTVEIYAPRLAYGTRVQPDRHPSDGREIADHKYEFPQELDLALYRVNHVHLINGFSANELMTNFAIVAGTPTYAGVDSDLPRHFVDFFRTFRQPDASWFHRGGLYSTLENERLLDLLGVGYDVDAAGNVFLRPNAVPRLAAFLNFQVESNRVRVLERLKAQDFDPTTTVLLNALPPERHPEIHSGRFRPLRYDTPKADRLTLEIAEDMPRLVLFNDRYSPSWEAYWNGTPLHILEANAIFMAVVLPEGTGELTFEFRPKLFLTLVKISSITAILLLLGGIIFLLQLWYGGTRARSRGLSRHPSRFG